MKENERGIHMLEICNNDLRMLNAIQILLQDYGVYSEIDEYSNTITFDRDVEFEEQDWNYIYFLVDYIGDELLLGYDFDTYRDMCIEIIGTIDSPDKNNR